MAFKHCLGTRLLGARCGETLGVRCDGPRKPADRGLCHSGTAPVLKSWAITGESGACEEQGAHLERGTPLCMNKWTMPGWASGGLRAPSLAAVPALLGEGDVLSAPPAASPGVCSGLSWGLLPLYRLSSGLGYSPLYANS